MSAPGIDPAAAARVAAAAERLVEAIGDVPLDADPAVAVNALITVALQAAGGTMDARSIARWLLGLSEHYLALATATEPAEGAGPVTLGASMHAAFTAAITMLERTGIDPDTIREGMLVLAAMWTASAEVGPDRVREVADHLEARQANKAPTVN